MTRLPLWLTNLLLRSTVRLKLSLVRNPGPMRTGFESRTRRFFRLPPGVRERWETLALGDRTLPALWCASQHADRRTVLLYFHGGGFVAGSPKTHRHVAAHLAEGFGARAVLPAYRLAPEAPFPAAVEDALGAYRALLERGYEAERIAVAGDSAGGGLAASLMLSLAREGLPQPAAAVLFSPWADMTGRNPSLRHNARRDVMLPVRRMEEVVGLYLGDAAPQDPLASPALGRFDHPPPTLIFASRSEILLDDAVALAEAMKAADGDVRLEIWRRMPHAWPVLVGRLEEADRAIGIAAEMLRRQLGRAEAA